MSKSETDRDDTGTDDRTTPGPDTVPDKEAVDKMLGNPADKDAIPGEHPEDNPDKEGEDRFDAG